MAGAIAALSFITVITRAQQSGRPPGPPLVDAKVLKNAGTPADALAGSWLSYGRSQSETRYSPLKQIDASNANRLGLAWTYVVGAGGSNQEGTPLVWNNDLRRHELERGVRAGCAHGGADLALGPRNQSIRRAA
jgi:glucose dehydrogenase